MARQLACLLAVILGYLLIEQSSGRDGPGRRRPNRPEPTNRPRKTPSYLKDKQCFDDCKYSDPDTTGCWLDRLAGKAERGNISGADCQKLCNHRSLIFGTQGAYCRCGRLNGRELVVSRAVYGLKKLGEAEKRMGGPDSTCRTIPQNPKGTLHFLDIDFVHYEGDDLRCLKTPMTKIGDLYSFIGSNHTIGKRYERYYECKANCSKNKENRYYGLYQKDRVGPILCYCGVEPLEPMDRWRSYAPDQPYQERPSRVCTKDFLDKHLPRVNTFAPAYQYVNPVLQPVEKKKTYISKPDLTGRTSGYSDEVDENEPNPDQLDVLIIPVIAITCTFAVLCIILIVKKIRSKTATRKARRRKMREAASSSAAK